MTKVSISLLVKMWKKYANRKKNPLVISNYENHDCFLSCFLWGGGGEMVVNMDG